MSNDLTSEIAEDRELFDGGPSNRLQGALHLRSPGRPHVVRRAVVVAVLTWGMLAVLAVAEELRRHDGSARSFFTDVATYARFLIAGPLFIFAERDCIPRLGSVARHFVEGGFVTELDSDRFDAAVASTHRLLDSKLAEIVVVILAYSIVITLYEFTAADSLSVWLRSSLNSQDLSPAGWWQALVSLPVVGVILLGWLWRVFLWWRLLWLISLLKLRLIPGHPDRCGGLKFVSNSLRGFRLLAFALGSIAAGVAANRVLRGEAHPVAFRYASAALVIIVVALFVGPLTVFVKQLRTTKKRGIFEYGALAGYLGWQFEQKWLDPKGRIDQTALEVGDFSATTDLYQVVSNVYGMKDFPFGLSNFSNLIAATLIPFIPVALLAVPFDVVLKELTKFFL